MKKPTKNLIQLLLISQEIELDKNFKQYFSSLCEVVSLKIHKEVFQGKGC